MLSNYFYFDVLSCFDRKHKPELFMLNLKFITWLTQKFIQISRSSVFNLSTQKSLSSPTTLWKFSLTLFILYIYKAKFLSMFFLTIRFESNLLNIHPSSILREVWKSVVLLRLFFLEILKGQVVIWNMCTFFIVLPIKQLLLSCTPFSIFFITQYFLAEPKTGAVGDAGVGKFKRTAGKRSFLLWLTVCILYCGKSTVLNGW